jgi:hypothetical protein
MAWYGVPSAIWTFLDADIAIAVGIQYYHIAMILLTISDNNRLKIGFCHTESLKLLQAEILHHAELLFGICTSTDTPETKITPCNAIPVCSAFLTDGAQQETLISILHRLERDVAWPTRRIALGAMEEWGWSDEDKLVFG